MRGAQFDLLFSTVYPRRATQLVTGVQLSKRLWR